MRGFNRKSPDASNATPRRGRPFLHRDCASSCAQPIGTVAVRDSNPARNWQGRRGSPVRNRLGGLRRLRQCQALAWCQRPHRPPRCRPDRPQREGSPQRRDLGSAPTPKGRAQSSSTWSSTWDDFPLSRSARRADPTGPLTSADPSLHLSRCRSRAQFLQASPATEAGALEKLEPARRFQESSDWLRNP